MRDVADEVRVFFCDVNRSNGNEFVSFLSCSSCLPQRRSQAVDAGDGHSCRVAEALVADYKLQSAVLVERGQGSQRPWWWQPWRTG